MTSSLIAFHAMGESEQNACQQRNGKRKSDNRRIHSDVIQPGYISGIHRSKYVQAASGNRNARDAAQKCEHHAFGEQLAHHPLPSGTESRAHGHFPLPSGGTCQQQVRDVRAGNQENQQARSEQHKQSAAHIADDLSYGGCPPRSLPAPV